jgi:hypothetical protein
MEPAIAMKQLLEELQDLLADLLHKAEELKEKEALLRDLSAALEAQRRRPTRRLKDGPKLTLIKGDGDGGESTNE